MLKYAVYTTDRIWLCEHKWYVNETGSGSGHIKRRVKQTGSGTVIINVMLNRHDLVMSQ